METSLKQGEKSMYPVSTGVLTNLDCFGLNLWGEVEDVDS